MHKKIGTLVTVLICTFLLSIVIRAQSTAIISPASSQPATAPPNLSLDEAIRTALTQHPSLTRAREAIRAADARAAQTKAGYFPQISVSGAAKQGLSGASGALGLRGLVTSPVYQDIGFSGALVQNIFDFGRTKHLYRASQWAAQALRPALDAEQDRITYNVQQAYYSALEEQRLVKVGEQTLAERQLAARQAEAFYKAELKSKADLSLAETNVSEANLVLVNARERLQTTFAGLNHAMGVVGEPSYGLEEPTITVAPPPAPESFITESQTRHHDLLSIDAQIHASEEIVALSKSNKWPKLTGLFSAGLLRFPQLSPGRLLLGAFGIDLPIFTGGRIKNEIAEAQANLARIHAAREEMAQDIRLEVQSAYNELVSSIESIRTSEQLVAQAREALRLAQARYRFQLGSFVELTTAEVAASNAEAQYAQARYKYKLAEAKLNYVTGRKYTP